MHLMHHFLCESTFSAIKLLLWNFLECLSPMRFHSLFPKPACFHFKTNKQLPYPPRPPSILKNKLSALEML